MAKAGAKLVSHVNTELWMTQEIIHDWEKKVFPPRAKEALPTETFYTTGKTTFGGEPVEYGLMPMAHTDGDIYVHFPQSNVLVAGDVVQPGRLPVLDFPTGGWIGGMQEAHRTLLRLANDTTKIVPATGPVMTKAEVQANLDILTKVREQLVKLMKQGKGPQDMIDAKAVKDFEGQLAGDPDQFLFTAYRGLWAHVRELGGIFSCVIRDVSQIMRLERLSQCVTYRVPHCVRRCVAACLALRLVAAPPQAASTRRLPANPNRALVNRYCVTLPQSKAQDRETGARCARS